MKRGGPIRPRSAKRVAEDREREKAKEVVRERARGQCEAAHAIWSIEPDIRCGGRFEFHEVLTRARGGSISDPTNLLMTCTAHHRFITEHPVEAASLGLVRNSWTEPTTKANLHVQVGQEIRRFKPTPSSALRAANTVGRARPRGGYESTGRDVAELAQPTEPKLVRLVFMHPERPFTLNGERKMTPYRRAEVVAEWRKAFWAMGVGSPRLAWANVEVKVHLRNQVGQDTCGALPAAKAAIDGLTTDAGVLPGDDPRYVRRVTFHAPEKGTYDALEVVMEGEPR